MKIKKSYLIRLIKECLNETPNIGFTTDTTVDRRLYGQELKQGENLHEPSLADIEHERMRMESLLFYKPNPQQYFLRLTKITKPQKMFTAFRVLKETYLEMPNTNRKQLLRTALGIAVKYLVKNGYGKYISKDDKRIFG